MLLWSQLVLSPWRWASLWPPGPGSRAAGTLTAPTRFPAASFSHTCSCSGSSLTRRSLHPVACVLFWLLDAELLGQGPGLPPADARPAAGAVSCERLGRCRVVFSREGSDARMHLQIHWESVPLEGAPSTRPFCLPEARKPCRPVSDAGPSVRSSGASVPSGAGLLVGRRVTGGGGGVPES